MTLRFPFLTGGLLLAGLAFTGTATQAATHDFPTLTRVTYVDKCVSQFDRPRQELIYKCSCAIDKIADEVDNDTWVALQTFNDAAPIAGERGAYIRERKDLRTHIKAFRDLESKVRKACFLPDEVRK